MEDGERGRPALMMRVSDSSPNISSCAYATEQWNIDGITKGVNTTITGPKKKIKTSIVTAADGVAAYILNGA